MKLNAVKFIFLALLVIGLPGCSKNPARLALDGGPRPVQKISAPEWSPKTPSSEFLRAAKILKPMPPETMQQAVAEGQLPSEAAAARYCKTWPAAYELFGTLTDKQIKRFESVGEIGINVPRLSINQRAALDRWFVIWRKSMKGGPVEFEDFLVLLYKAGATKDLSNVEVGFWTGGRTVHLRFRVVKGDKELFSSKLGFANI